MTILKRLDKLPKGRALRADLRKQRRDQAWANRKAENLAIRFTTQRAYCDAYAEFVRLTASAESKGE